jgi:hypothetical protein
MPSWSRAHVAATSLDTPSSWRGIDAAWNGTRII